MHLGTSVIGGEYVPKNNITFFQVYLYVFRHFTLSDSIFSFSFLTFFVHLHGSWFSINRPPPQTIVFAYSYPFPTRNLFVRLLASLVLSLLNRVRRGPQRDLLWLLSPYQALNGKKPVRWIRIDFVWVRIEP